MLRKFFFFLSVLTLSSSRHDQLKSPLWSEWLYNVGRKLWWHIYKKSLYSVHTLRLSGRTSSGLILASSAVEISRIGAMAASWGYWRFNKSTTMVKINWIFKKIHECCKQIVSVYKIFRDTVHSVIQRWALARLSRCYGNILVKSTIVLKAR